MKVLWFLDQDGRDWGWMTEEVEEGTPGSLQAVSVQSLLRKYDLATFDYIKLDIEGSEWQLFRQDESLAWLDGVKLMSLEVRANVKMLLAQNINTCVQNLLMGCW